MGHRSGRFHSLRVIGRWVVLTSLLITSSLNFFACQRAPALVVTPTGAASAPTQARPAPTRTPTEVPPTLTQPPPSPSPSPVPTCAPHPPSMPTQAPAAALPATVTADGLVQGRVLPSPYLVPNYVQAPVAWARSTGEGVTVGVAQNHAEDLALVQLIAPGSQVAPLVIDRELRVGGAPLLEVAQQREIRLLALIEPGDFDPQALRQIVPELVEAGVTVLINGDLNRGAEERELINALEASGVITVGRLKNGARVQGPDIYQRQINLFASYGADGSTFDRGAVLTVAGVAALVLAAEPELTPQVLKHRLVDTADERFTGVDPVTGAVNQPVLGLNKETGDYSPLDSALRVRRVNAANAVGVHLEHNWSLNAMNVPAAWKTATGKGVIVGVLDTGFRPDNPALQGHIVDMVPTYVPSDAVILPHGTLVAKVLVQVAPDVSLVFFDEDANGWDWDSMAQAEVAAIEYAIQHGVQVLSSSNRSWANTPEVHAAIDRAIEAGIVVVFSDYNGPNKAVIRAGYFYSPVWEVGGFSLLLDTTLPVEYERGLSFTPPQIAGVAAMILQNEPDLTPMQVKQRILETASVLPYGNSIVDAAAAVENRPSGRQVDRLEPSAGGEGQLHLVYQAAEDAPVILELGEQHLSWSLGAWPRQDILAYRILPSTVGPYTNTFMLTAYQDYNQVLRIEWQGTEWESGDFPARLTLLPYDDEWGLFYSMELGVQDVPPLHVEVVCDKVYLSWSSPDGAMMDSEDYETGGSMASGVRLFSFEIETPLLPDLVDPIY